MTALRRILISGATGKQGGALADALAGQGFELRAMTRKPDSPAAQALAARGVAVVGGDLEDPASLRQALDEVWGAFAVQNSGEAGAEREEEQGKRFAAVAKEAGVQHFVYTSVASAHRHTGIPHFESKWRIEAAVRELNFPTHVILRPVFFMENLVSPWFLRGETLAAALKPGMSLQMIAVADIGKYAALAFTDSERLNGRAIDLAGDVATMSAAAEALWRGIGRPIRFVEIPIAEVRSRSADIATMYEWFEHVGFDVDIPTLERELGIRSTRLVDWAARQGTAA